jgi:hypothetical protein
VSLSPKQKAGFFFLGTLGNACVWGSHLKMQHHLTRWFL